MIKKAVLMVMSIVVSLVYPISALAYSGSGDGSVGSPYLISTCDELQEMRDNLDANYRLTDDINCNLVGLTWEPIGFDTGFPFTGTFDGDNYTIYNLAYSGGMYAGLFGNVFEATLKNVTLASANITSTGMVGVLAGTTLDSTIQNVNVSNSVVYSELNAGGLVGILQSTTLSDSAAYNTYVSGRSPASFGNQLGGLVGVSIGSTIDRVSSSGGAVTPNSEALGSSNRFGGLIGSSISDVISDSYSAVEVSGDDNIGGFIGFASSTAATRSYASGDVSGNTNVGGLVGYGALTGIDHSFATGATSNSGDNTIGGVIGHADGAGATTTGSTWDVTRTGQTDCVGLDDTISVHPVCSGVNVSNADSSYFFNNISNTPFDQWDFDTVWQTTTDLPILITTPDRADNVSVVRTATTLGVRWGVPATTGGSAITSYDLKYRPSGAVTSTVVLGLPANNPSQYTISGLSPDTEYTVELRAHNDRGAGIWTGFITTTLAPAIIPPTTTTGPAKTISPVDDTQVTEEMTPIETPDATTDIATTQAPQTAQADATDEAGTTSSLTPILITIGVIVGLAILIWIIRLLKSRSS